MQFYVFILSLFLLCTNVEQLLTFVSQGECKGGTSSQSIKTGVCEEAHTW